MKQEFQNDNDDELCMQINEIQDRIVEEISVWDDLTDKYKYIIDMAKGLAMPDEQLRSEEYLIHGCQSSVWIKVEYKDDKINLWGDSDSLITKGMIALLIRVLNNQPVEQILDADLYFIHEAGLSSHLSPARADGLAAIINHIKTSVKNTVHF
jgi:cysteine desulfuration protein SufE